MQSLSKIKAEENILQSEKTIDIIDLNKELFDKLSTKIDIES